MFLRYVVVVVVGMGILLQLTQKHDYGDCNREREQVYRWRLKNGEKATFYVEEARNLEKTIFFR